MPSENGTLALRLRLKGVRNIDKLIYSAATLIRRSKKSDIYVIGNNNSDHITVSTFYFTYLGRIEESNPGYIFAGLAGMAHFFDSYGDYGSTDRIRRCSNDWW